MHKAINLFVEELIHVRYNDKDLDSSTWKLVEKFEDIQILEKTKSKSFEERAYGVNPLVKKALDNQLMLVLTKWLQTE